MYWLRLIRWKNLVIILLTQVLVWWSVVFPEEPEVLKQLHFVYMVASTLLIAAAGYIINDYFDIRIDLVNKPDRVILGKVIPRKDAIVAHAVLNAAALALAAIVAVKAHHPEWLLLQVGCIVLLWFYSTHLKRIAVWGNVAIALLSALTVLMLIVYEPVLQVEYVLPILPGVAWHSGSSLPVWIILVYAYFAFMLTWMREVVKDMEDYEGDGSDGCTTLPIRQGLRFATRFTIALGIFVVLPLIAGAWLLHNRQYVLMPAYIAFLLVAPTVVWGVFLQGNNTQKHYHRASTWLKVIMLLGILSLLVYHVELYGNLIKE